MADVKRFDSHSVSAVTRMDNGYLKVPATLTKAGVFPYRLPDGSIQWELRHPDDVLDKESVSTMALIPATLNHPPEMLNSKNTKQYQVGNLSDRIDTLDTVLAGDILITDEEAVAEVELGTKRQISMGYRCKLVPEVGTYEGKKYTMRQKNIRYNHVAILAKGRAGPDIAIKMDSGDAVLDESQTPEIEHVIIKEVAPNPMEGNRMDERVKELEAQVNDLTSQLDSLRKDRDATAAKLDAAQDRLDAAEAENAKRQDADEFHQAVAARVALERQAAPVLKEDNLQGKTDLAIRLAVLEKLCPKANVEGKSEDYIIARYDAALEAFEEDEQELDKLEDSLKPQTRTDGSEFSHLDSQFIPLGGKR